MNREIKFRVWDKSKKEFQEVERYKNEFISIALGFYSEICVSPDDLVLQQFTNFKDKKGNEIFEGDYVRAKTNFSRGGNIPSYLEVEGVVEYHLESAQFLLRYENKEFNVKNATIALNGLYESEIVGNNFDNLK